MPDPTDPRAVADGPSAESQDALTYVDVDVSWGNGETYPVRVASLSADQARRMFGWDPTDPRAVVDDPSGIVQQMPEGGDDALKDLRAEVERLQVSLMAARKGLQGVKEMVLRGHQRNTIMQACETEQVKLDIALSPETDGGQDG